MAFLVAVLGQLREPTSTQELARVIGRLSGLLSGAPLVTAESFCVRYSLASGWTSAPMNRLLLIAAKTGVFHEGNAGWSLGKDAEPAPSDAVLSLAVHSAVEGPVHLDGFTREVS